MYRQGLGDCFLLSFWQGDDQDNASHVLIDCGTLGSKATGIKMEDVVADIAESTKHKLALLVATHEHQDHLSGFNSQRSIFEKIGVANSWVAWTENPDDKLAQKLKKYASDLGIAALTAGQALAETKSADAALTDLAGGINEALSFVGDVKLGATFAKGVDEAMRYVANKAPEGCREYLTPGTFLTPEWLPGVTVYVLGPPRSEEKIKNMGEHGNPELYELSANSVSAFRAVTQLFAYRGDRQLGIKDYCGALAKGNRAEELDELKVNLPFDRRYRVDVKDAAGGDLCSYFDQKNEWRRIDKDWLFSSADLALQLDNLTNNTSLVLAFEIGEKGPVILMAADAQLGSWLSWHDYTWKVPDGNGHVRQVKAKDLLERTVVYKVGHHSSYNATAVQHGLDMMNSDSLIALIPLDGKVAQNKNWSMPAEKLYDRLVEKTKGRVLRSDTGWPENEAKPESVKAGEWKHVPANAQIDIQEKFVEVTIAA